MEDDSWSVERRSAIFSELKRYCLQLLELHQNPSNSNSSSATISPLLQLLRSSSPDDLHPFLDFTLLPLLLLFDMAVDCRSQKKMSSEEKATLLNAPTVPPKLSDSVAEGVVLCLEELLKKCQLASMDQMVVLLKKLTCGAMLSPSEASEEFRGGVIRCFRALLLSLHPCSKKSCLCKEACSSLKLLSGAYLEVISRLPKCDPGECLLAFLQSHAASAAVGHWLSLLLKAADTEAVRGHRGSAELRIEAFLTLRILVARVGTADALAFFLPGVVSQFAKVLHGAKSIISGAAGSAEAIDQAIRGLAEFLIVVLQDAANLSVNEMPMKVNSGRVSVKAKPVSSFLEELRRLPEKSNAQTESAAEDSRGELIESITSTSKSAFKDEMSSDSGILQKSLHVNRTKEWLESTTGHVNKMLCATFPQICVHPMVKVRRGLLAAIQGLLSSCSCTLQDCRTMFLECLCVLVCDDSVEVSVAAHEFLASLLSSSRKHLMEHDVSQIFRRVLKNLPEAILRSEESLALSHAQQLLVVTYYSGPQFVVDHLFHSPVAAAQFLDVFAHCFSQNSLFARSLQSLVLEKPSSTGFLRSVAELKSGSFSISDSNEVYKFQDSQNKQAPYSLECLKEYELPHIPPWFIHVGSQKLYQTLAEILRLVGSSLLADSKPERTLSAIIDIPLNYLRNLVSDLRVKNYSQQSWQSWYARTASGQLLRQASTAVYIVNEITYGMSDRAIESFKMIFPNSGMMREVIEKFGPECAHTCPRDPGHVDSAKSGWKICWNTGARNQLIDCIGSVLHEYLSPEIWDLPTEYKYSLLQSDDEPEDIALHCFHDSSVLHQVIVDGIGIFGLCLGKDFASSGFLHSSLYLLLENLICSNSEIRHAADTVLHILSAVSGHPTVGHLVMANSDYVIDSICRQLRHLDLNPHVPAVLASLLSYIGVADQILPLLDEPMRSVSRELEILGRHQHPRLTVPFLKAVAEIAKSSKHEACSMPSKAEAYSMHVISNMSDAEKRLKASSNHCSVFHCDDETDMQLTVPVESSTYCGDANGQRQEWENILFKLNDSKRYRRIVGSLAGSCLLVATPLLASGKGATALVALDIVEDGITTLAKVEEAYKHEKKCQEAIKRVAQLCSYYHLNDALAAIEEGTDENMLLPAMNKIWPFLVLCIQNNNPAVVRRCLSVISNAVQICGGDFFSRRFHKDGQQFWKLLSVSPFWKKPYSKEEKAPLQLPYRSSGFVEDSKAEVSNLRVQVAVLNMIVDLSRNKRSASALEVVLKKVSGLVVGIACSGIVGLRDASINALMGLSSMDPDLIWLLIADVYYSMKKKDMPSPPSSCYPEISQMLPPPALQNEYLHVQYGGKSFGFDVDISSVEYIFKLRL